MDPPVTCSYRQSLTELVGYPIRWNWAPACPTAEATFSAAGQVSTPLVTAEGARVLSVVLAVVAEVAGTKVLVVLVAKLLVVDDATGCESRVADTFELPQAVATTTSANPKYRLALRQAETPFPMSD
jgi:hypothetical protein